MGVAIVAFGVTCVAVLSFVLLVIRFAKFGVVRTSLLVVLGLLFFPAFLFLFQVLLASTVSHGTNVPPNEVPFVDLPGEATDVSYLSKYGPMRLVSCFTISEKRFLVWMNETQRPIEALVNEERVPCTVAANPTTFANVVVQSGYRWDNYNSDKRESGNDDSGTTIVFDSSNDRAFIWITGW